MSKRLALFDKLIAEGSTDPFHYYARAMELRALGDPAAALRDFAAVTTRFPDYLPSYLMAAQLAHELGEDLRARVLASAGIEVAERTGNDHALSELTALLESLPV